MYDKSQKIFSLYCITNLANNKIYIGQSVNYQQRWRQHKFEAKKENPSMIINKAMKKYGIENFLFEVISMCKTLDDANETETILVKQYESHISTGKGYNVSNGGSNAPKTEEWKQKMKEYREDSIWMDKYVESCSKAAKIRCIEQPHTLPPKNTKRMLGKTHSEETKRKMSVAAKKNQPLINKSGRRKLSAQQTQEILLDARSTRKIAASYGISKTLVSSIKKRGN